MAHGKYDELPFDRGELPWLWPALVSLALFLWAHHAAFFDSSIINDDVRQQLFWMQRWLDPELYPGDLLGDYARLYVPWGVQAVYFLASHVISPLAFSKILTGVLYVFMATLVFLTGRRVGGSALGLSCVAAFWFMPFFLHNISGGLARAFAGPLLMLFLYGWVSRSRWLVASALVLQSIFIPYIFVLCTGAAGLGWLGWRLKLLQEPPLLARLADFAVLGCALGLLVGWHAQMSGAGFGPLPGYDEMLGLPEFSPDGRFPVVPVPSVFHEIIIRPWELIARFRHAADPAGFVWLIGTILLLVAFAPRAPWRMWKEQLAPVLCLALASLTLYVAARIVLLQLFLPSRYLEYSVNIGWCFLIGMSLYALSSVWKQGRRTIVLVAVVFALLGAYRISGEELYDYSSDRAVCEYLESHTAKDALIAGHPYQMDNVLTLGKRNVFASYELAHPWNLGYWAKMKPRLEALFAAYYANDLAAVAAFCSGNGIDYLVVDKRFYAPDFIAGTPFFEPFGSRIRKQAEAGQFVLLEPSVPAFEIDDNIRVIDVRKLAKAAMVQ